MLGRLIPRDQHFFELFDRLADHLTASARLLDKLFSEPDRVSEHVRAIKDEEHKADQLNHLISERIDKSFVTPFDREDIHLLASRLDDVVDLLDGTARRFEILHIKEVREPARRMSDVPVRAAECIENAVAGVKKPTVVSRYVGTIKQLEEEGDAIYHEAVGALFRQGADPLDVLRWKEMYDTLERAIDSCMGVANVLQSISFKNA